ncbi:hypothetical protein ABOONEI_2333 [Aciduliprofundum boonei T469]|nr:hypothetical protein ABOONEI_2333 [Aciduliprofundum boonei T469]
MRTIPEEFINYAYEERVALIKKMLEGKFDDSILIGFTRHNAAIMTSGPAGLNGSIKGVGFIHKDKILPDTIKKDARRIAQRVQSYQGWKIPPGRNLPA